MTNLASITGFAKMTGRSRWGIHIMINRGEIIPETVDLADGTTRRYINIEKYPPEDYRKENYKKA